jgi:hypothetical protein
MCVDKYLPLNRHWMFYCSKVKSIDFKWKGSTFFFRANVDRLVHLKVQSNNPTISTESTFIQ